VGGGVAQQARGGGPQLSQELARQLSDITKKSVFRKCFGIDPTLDPRIHTSEKIIWILLFFSVAFQMPKFFSLNFMFNL
jgi:hypothetical protein